MSKKPAGKIKLTPIKPLDGIRKLEKNGFRLKEKKRGMQSYIREKNGKTQLLIAHLHPTEEWGIPYVELTIKKAGKTKEEWVSL